MNPLYKPVDTESIKREIQSAQTVIELLLLMAAEKEAEKPARSGNFETTFTVDGKERKVERTPDGRFAATKKAVGDAAAAVGKAAGSAGKAVGDVAKGLLETDQEKFQKALDSTQVLRETVGTGEKASRLDKSTETALDLMDRIGNNQIKRDPKLKAEVKDMEGRLKSLEFMKSLGYAQPEEFEKAGNEIMNSIAELIAKSLEDNPGFADKTKKAIRNLPSQIANKAKEIEMAFKENPKKIINEAEAAFQSATEQGKTAISNFQHESLEMFKAQKKENFRWATNKSTVCLSSV